MSSILHKPMKESYTYAHNDTSSPERPSATASLNNFPFLEGVKDLREGAFKRNIPVASDETLAFLSICVKMARPKNILEIGTAIGVSGICMLKASPDSRLTTIEVNNDFAYEAESNFALAHMQQRETVLKGDAAEILPTLTGAYDFIFLDGPKVQYKKYLPYLIDLLPSGGTLFSDDLLMYGWVNGEQPTPPKRHMLVQHIREYISLITTDTRLTTQILNVGNGVGLSVKN